MKEIVSILLIGISLSMDTFSLSLSISSINNSLKYLKIFPFLVGMFHFFMPLLGNYIGLKLIAIFNLASNIILGIILIALGINLAFHYFKDEKIDLNFTFISIVLLALSVSIDSFTVGIGINNLTTNYYIASIIFSICSFLFTLLGLIIGKYSSKIMGKYANILGILLLLILGFNYLI